MKIRENVSDAHLPVAYATRSKLASLGIRPQEPSCDFSPSKVSKAHRRSCLRPANPLTKNRPVASRKPISICPDDEYEASSNISTGDRYNSIQEKRTLPSRSSLISGLTKSKKDILLQQLHYAAVALEDHNDHIREDRETCGKDCIVPKFVSYKNLAKIINKWERNENNVNVFLRIEANHPVTEKDLKFAYLNPPNIDFTKKGDYFQFRIHRALFGCDWHPNGLSYS